MSADTLKPAAELAGTGSRPFPNESAEYREARTALLAEEIELRRHIQRVAAQRLALPPGGEANEYRFLDEHGHELRLVDPAAPDRAGVPVLLARAGRALGPAARRGGGGRAHRIVAAWRPPPCSARGQA